jgi:predicted metal-dependent enzyme (double-stranded beta helix superfamily)
MTYSLEQFGLDIRSQLNADPGVEGLQRILEFVRKALLDDAFVETHIKAEECQPRKVLYEDPDLGFCICGHIYKNGVTNAWPHDHGSVWAIYGLAQGQTEMTDWEVVQKGDDNNPTLVKPSRSYEMKRGDCYLYKVGDIHSPIIGKGTKLVRVEGKNLDHVQRSKIKAA